jgi:hypothetical protein
MIPLRGTACQCHIRSGKSRREIRSNHPAHLYRPAQGTRCRTREVSGRLRPDPPANRRHTGRSQGCLDGCAPHRVLCHLCGSTRVCDVRLCEKRQPRSLPQAIRHLHRICSITADANKRDFSVDNFSVSHSRIAIDEG